MEKLAISSNAICLLVALCILGSDLSAAETGIYYQEYFISDYCGANESHPIYLKEYDSKSVMILKSVHEEDMCSVIHNCSAVVVAPPGYGLIITPLFVEIDHDVGILNITANNISILSWSKTVHLNGTEVVSYSTAAETGYSVVTFEMRKIAATWKHAKFKILFTAYYPLLTEQSECPKPFYHNCKNKRCIRKALLCDRKNNCGNLDDEKECRQSIAEITVLVSFGIIMTAFVGFVLIKYRRLDLDHDPNEFKVPVTKPESV